MAGSTVTLRPLRAQLLIALPALLLSDIASAFPYPYLIGARNDKQAQAEVMVQCQRVRYQRVPVLDQPRRTGPAQCDARALYDDTRAMKAPGDADWQAVRDCAFSTGDNSVLMMLYANGDGVAPNLGLAMRFACSSPGTATEMQARLKNLVQRGARVRIDQCDQAPGTTACAGVRERRGVKPRAGDELGSLARGWAPKEQVGFEMALQAVRYFAQHHRDNETDTSSVAHARVQAEVEAAELERFGRDVEEFQQGMLPSFSEADFAKLDAKMNETYRQFMQTAPAPDSYLGNIRKSGVEKTQQAWLAYRDAMELFTSIKYPAMSSSSLRALLTSRRLRQLTELDNAILGK